MNFAIPLSNNIPPSIPEGAEAVEIESAEHRAELVAGGGVVVIKYSAGWCGPCKKIAGAYHELGGEFEGVKFAEEDIDEEFEGLPEQIKSVPTFFYFKDGEFKESTKGANIQVVKDTLKKYI
jgi:thioredoxin 1